MRRLALALLAAATAACQPAATVTGELDVRRFASAGASREYRVYRPRSLAERPALVLVLHGHGGSGTGIRRRTGRGFDALADRDGFIVAYPEALQGHWNAGYRSDSGGPDDVAFLSTLAEALVAEFHIDPKRVHATGLSNGASMAWRLACERPQQVAAIAPVAGGLAEPQMRPCAQGSKRPIPLLVMHGTDDDVVPFGNGELEGNLQYWIRRNGCTPRPVVSHLPDADPDDGTRTRVENHRDCTEQADVVLYAIEGGGHEWPGGVPLLRSHGRMSRDFDAAAVIWDFFSRHPMP